MMSTYSLTFCSVVFCFIRPPRANRHRCLPPALLRAEMISVAEGQVKGVWATDASVFGS